MRDSPWGLKENIELIWNTLYYYKGFSKSETSEILSGIGKTQTCQTSLAEYAAAHDMKQLVGLLDKENMLNIPGYSGHTTRILQRKKSGSSVELRRPRRKR